MKKRIVSWILLLTFLFIQVPINVFATDRELSTYNEAQAYITVEEAFAKFGSTVSMDISISDNPGVAGATLQISYDSRLTLIQVNSGEAFEGLDFSYTNGLPNPCNLTWDSESGQVTANGVIATLTFTVSEDAEVDEKLFVNVSYRYGDVYSENEDLTLEIQNGSILVLSYTPGDVNDDGVVNTKDTRLTRQLVAGGYESEFEENGITVNSKAADVNGDGTLNTKDTRVLRRYVAGGYGEVLRPSIPACAHSMAKTTADPATCTEPGNIEYWTCTKCNKLFDNEAGTKEIKVEDTVVPIKHTTTHVAEKEATEIADGNIEYWSCSACGKIFADVDCNMEIKLEDTVIPKPTGTTYTVFFRDAETKKATFVSLDNQETYISSLTNDKNVRLDFPQITKYGFSALCLTDNNGEIITSIEPGTTGNIDVYVHWMSNRNKTYPVKELGKPQIIEDKENGQIFFVYEIGEIRYVPIERLSNIIEVDKELVHEETKVIVKNTATQNASSIAQSVSNATTNSASMTLSDEWTNKYQVDEEWASTQEKEVVEGLKNYVENGGQWNISSQFGGEDIHSKNSGSSISNSHKEATGKVTSTAEEIGEETESQVSAKLTSSLSAEEFGISAEISAEMSAYEKENDTWKKTENEENSSGTEDSEEKVEYKDISDSYTNSWNTEESYTQSQKMGTETDISNALRTAITENSKKSYSDEYKEGSLTTEAQDITNSQGREYSSAITFSTSEELTNSTTTKQTFVTKGFYRYVRMGTLDVYAVVTYDIKNSAYSLSTFSMFEKDTFEKWDFSEDGSFSDGEIGVLPFEVPYEVEEYVLSETAYTKGLIFNTSRGEVTRYEGTEKNVLIPNYYSKNGNMTLITALGNDSRNNNKPAFAGNENIEVVRLSKFITSIPEGAFAGCKNLKTVIAPGVTSIGANAFDGCENLDKFIVSTKVTSLGDNAFKGCPEVIINASNSSVARAATTAGANRVTINVAEMSGEFAEVVNGSNNEIIADYTCGYTIDIGNISYFAFYGGGKTFENVKLISNAQETYLENATFTSDSGVTFKIASPKITFKKVNAKNDNVAMLAQADSANILIAEDSVFSALSQDKKTKVVTKNIVLFNYSGETAQWIIDGILYIFGNTDFDGKYIAEADTVKSITSTEYEKFELGSCTVTFNPNGGEVDKTSISVDFDAAIGTLPVPTREGFEFIGWFDESGNQIDAERKVDEDFTIKARWLSDYVLEEKVPQDAEITEDAKWEYDLTETKESSQDYLEGYTLYDTTWEWGEYGPWSAWQKNAISENEAVKVETRRMYSYYYYLCKNCGYHHPWQQYCKCGHYVNDWNEAYFPIPHTNANPHIIDGSTWYERSDGDGPEYNEYRSCTRGKIYTYHHKKTSRIQSPGEIPTYPENYSVSNVQKLVRYIVK